MEEAVGLSLGDFLPRFYMGGVPFQEWLIVQREELHRLVMDCLDQLIDNYLLRGSYMRVEGYLQKQLALEPWREEAHRMLMHLMALRGQRSEALAQYQVLQNNLQRTFDAAPSPQTEALHDSIIHGKIPELRTSQFVQSNLPAQLTSFIGRESESRWILEALVKPSERLVTITGLGGIGKTRLALSVAQELNGSFSQGVWWISLADISRQLLIEMSNHKKASVESRLVEVIVRTLEIKLESNRPPFQQLVEFLRHREILIVLDNFEPFVGPGTDVVLKILQMTHYTKFLVTSRRRLGLQAERLIELSGLPIPDQDAVDLNVLDDNEEELLEQYPSIRLFFERARLVDSFFDLNAETLPEVIQVCLAR